MLHLKKSEQTMVKCPALFAAASKINAVTLRVAEKMIGEYVAQESTHAPAMV